MILFAQTQFNYVEIAATISKKKVQKKMIFFKKTIAWALIWL